MTRLLRILPLLLLFTSCMRWDYGLDVEDDFSAPARGLFIINEGNFQYGNATLSFYDPAANRVENEVFFRANGMKLGDVAQSMTMYDGRAWIVVNNSRVVFAINPTTFREVARITGFTSPRYIHFVNSRKAYVTQIWDNRIAVVDIPAREISGYITVPDMDAGTGSTEQMVQLGRYVYCNCWSYQNRLLKIDSEADRVVGSLEVGSQPNSLVLDRNGKLWTLCDDALYRVDPESFTVEQSFAFSNGAAPSELQLNGAGDLIYWLNDDVWRMSVSASRLPAAPFLRSRHTKYYGLTIDSSSGEVYVADAVDYQQQGLIYRYSPSGILIDEFYAGVIPGAFCWK